MKRSVEENQLILIRNTCYLDNTHFVFWGREQGSYTCWKRSECCTQSKKSVTQAAINEPAYTYSYSGVEVDKI